MLEGLLKGLVLWVYQLILEGVENLSGALIEVFDMDLAYFEAHVPVVTDIIQIMMAAGWALLIGNLTFQAMRAMVSGLGFEAEDPQILFARTFVFSFLLMVNRQICGIGLTLTSRVMDLLGMPDSIAINIPTGSHFGFGDSTWLVVVVIGLILIFQIIRFFFEIAERYVILATLTIMAPLAFGMVGSKSTEDIFKGWVRMYGSMCVMMLMNVVFLKLLLSAMSAIPSGAGVLPWLLFVVAIARVARKVDDLICRIGLNPARTGDPLGRGNPLMVTMAAVRGMGRTVAATMGGQGKGGKGGAAGKAGGAGHSPRPGPPPRSGGDPGQPPARRSDSPSQTEAVSVTAQSQAAAAGQSAPSTAPQRPADRSPAKGQGKRPQGSRQPALEAKHGGPKPSAATSTKAPPSPPVRPPLNRKGPDAVPPQGQRTQDQLTQPAGKNLSALQNAAASPGADTKTTLHSSQLQRQGGTPVGGAVQGGKEGQSPALTRPPIQRSGTPSQERPLAHNTRRNGSTSGAGESSPASRRKDLPQRASATASGEAPPTAHRNDPPRQTPAPGSGEALPASRRNSGSPKSVPPAAEPPQNTRRNGPGIPIAEAVLPASKPAAGGQPPSPRRDSVPQTATSPEAQAAPHSTGRKGVPSQPPPVKEAPQPAPGRKTVPRETAPQDRPSRPPLNQERGGKP